MCHLNPHYFQKYTRINCRIIFFFCFLNTNTVVIFVNECPFWILHYRLTKCLFMWIKSVIQTTKDLYSHGWPSQVLKSLCYRLAWRSADLYDRWTSSSKTLSLELHWSLSSKPCTVGHALILHWLETNHPDVRGDYIVLGTALGRTYKNSQFRTDFRGTTWYQELLSDEDTKLTIPRWKMVCWSSWSRRGVVGSVLAY